jgi:hypothetical protein
VIPPHTTGSQYFKAAPGDGMHALRHAYVSVLLDAGETIKALAEHLGARTALRDLPRPDRVHALCVGGLIRRV